MSATMLQGPPDDSLMEFSSESFQRNPYPAYAALRRKHPVYWSARHRCYFVLGYEQVRTVLQSRDYGVDSPFRASRTLLGRTVMDVDGQEHARLRSLTNRSFTPSAVPGHVEGLVVPVVNESIDTFHSQGKAELVAQFANLIPLRVLARIIGIPIEDVAFFQGCSTRIIALLDSTTAQPGVQESARQAVAELKAYLAGVLDRARAAADDTTVIGQLVRSQREHGNVTDTEIINQVCLLIPAAIDTSSRLMANTLVCLFQHPQQQRQVEEDPALLSGAIEETLRFEPPIHSTVRIALKPLELGGTSIRKGALVQVMLASANRDEASFAEPDRFDLHRQEQRHLAFGGGRHQCMGRSLALAEVQETLRLLFARCRNLRPAPGDSPLITGISFRSPRALNVIFDPA